LAIEGAPVKEIANSENIPAVGVPPLSATALRDAEMTPTSSSDKKRKRSDEEKAERKKKKEAKKEKKEKKSEAAD
jgi:hypothetical protein